jgi:hypothetical protein
MKSTLRRVGKGARSLNRAAISVACMRAVPTRFPPDSRHPWTRGHGATREPFVEVGIVPGAFAHPTNDSNRSKSAPARALMELENSR